MLKNKKKLRRLERNTPGYAVKAARSLVFAGLLLAPALAGDALAAPVTWGDVTTIDANSDAQVLDGIANGKLLGDSLTISGGSLTLKNSSFVHGQAGSYTGAPTAAMIMPDGTLTVTDSQIAMKTVAIGGGVVNVSGTIVDGVASPVGHWRNGAQIFADKSLTMTGGTVNLSDNAQMVVGRSGSSDLNAMIISGGTVNLSNALLRATSKTGQTINDPGDYSKIVIGGGIGAAIVATADDTGNVIASRLTEIKANGQLNINGDTMLVALVAESRDANMPPLGDFPDAWAHIDGGASGTLINDGGSVNVSNSGVLMASAIDYVQKGAGSTFSASKLALLDMYYPESWKGDGAAFKSVTLQKGKMHLDSMTIAADKLIGVSSATPVTDGQFQITVDPSSMTNEVNAGQLVVQNLTLTSGTDGSVGGALSGITNPNNLAIRVLTAKGGTSDAANTDLTIKGAAHILGDGQKFLEAKSLTIDSGGFFLIDNYDSNDPKGMAQGGTFLGKTTVESGGQFAVSTSAKVTLGAVETSGGFMVNGGSDITIASLDQKAGGVVVGYGSTIGQGDSTGKLTITGAFKNQAYTAPNGQNVAPASGILIGSAGALVAKYGEIVNTTGTDFKDTGSQKAIFIKDGGILRLEGYTGAGMSLADLGALAGKLLHTTGSNGVIEGIKVNVTSSDTLQNVGDAHAAVTESVVAAGNLTSGAAAVGGVVGTAATAVSGGASLILTGQGAAQGKLTEAKVTLNNGALTLGNAAGGSTGGTLVGGIDASGSTAANTINTVNGVFHVQGDIKGGTGNDTVNVLNNSILNVAQIDLSTGGTNEVNVTGGALNAGTITGSATTTIKVGSETSTGQLTADSVKLNGGSLFIDPSWGEASSRVAIAQFTDTGSAADVSALGGKVGVGMNSMLSVGTKDTALLDGVVGKLGGLEQDGYTAALGLYHSVTLGNGAGGIEVDGTKNTGTLAPAVDTATFAEDSLLVVNAPAGLGDHAALVSGKTGNGALNLDKDATLLVVNGQAGQTVKITENFTLAETGTGTGKGWTGDNLFTDTALVYGEGTWSTTNTGDYSVALKSRAATEVFPKLSASMGGLVDNVMRVRDLDSPNAGIRFVSRATSDAFIGRNDAEKAAATIEGAAQMGAVAGVQISTIGAASVASGAVTTRTSFAQPLMDMTKAVAVHQDNDGTLSLDTGLNAGNGMKNGLGVWIMPLYQSNNTWGQKAENFKSGMSSDLGGIALGADYTINDMFRFGAAFNVGGGYAQSSGDFNETENRFNFWGVNLYGGWTMNNFGLSADVGYTSSFNAVEQDTPAAMAMGNLKADVTTSAWTAGLKGEYKFETSVVDIIPHVGVRYMGLTTDSYDVKSGGTVFGVEQDFQSIWTFPIGVAFSKTFTSDSGPSAWTFKPMVDLTVIPAAGDLKAKSKASIPGVGGQAEMKMQVVDYVTFDGGVGFEVGKGDLSFGLNYNIQASEHRTGHGVFGTLRYEF